MQIKHLKLYTNNIDKQKEFYHIILGLEILRESSDSFSVKIGESILTFMLGEEEPAYHFAINIPSSQINDSYKWIKQKVDLLDFEGEVVIKFDNWNAEAMYFYDADNNLVEFIARKNLKINLQNEFSADSLLYISEIGVPTSDIKNIYAKLNRELSLEIYDGDFERFCAIGNETGLFIVVNYKLKNWFPTMEAAKPVPFHIKIKVEKGMEYELKYEKEIIQIIGEL